MQDSPIVAAAKARVKKILDTAIPKPKKYYKRKKK